MNTNLNKWLQQTYDVSGVSYISQKTRPHLTCNDGTTLSVQASSGHYCKPRESYVDCYSGGVEIFDYSKVEVWCVSSDIPESWLDYGDQDTNPYAYIPVSLVEEFIDLHGGIKE